MQKKMLEGGLLNLKQWPGSLMSAYILISFNEIYRLFRIVPDVFPLPINNFNHLQLTVDYTRSASTSVIHCW